MIQVVKRNGKTVPFEKDKIAIAVEKAFGDIGETNKGLANRIANDVLRDLLAENVDSISIYKIENRVEDKLMASHHKDVARAYIEYRHKKQISREVNKEMYKRNKTVLELLNDSNNYLMKENSNKDAVVLSTKRDYMAGEVSKEISEKFMFDKDLIKAHKDGIIHIHDLDFAAMPMHNCDLVNLEDMFTNGTTMSKVAIATPKSLSTAVTLATQIVIQIASSQYGGQTISLAHLAPFVRASYEKHKKEVREEGIKVGIVYTDDQIKAIADERLKKEIKHSIQTLQYQLVSCSISQGQSPFVSLFMYLGETKEYKAELAMLIEEVLKQRYAGIPNKQGVPVTIAFPKLLYVLEEDNIHEDSPYYYLTELAVKCSSKRLVPDYISEKKMKEYKNGQVFPCMGCRSFLPDYIDENGKHKFYGRFNQGVVTLSLPDVALSSKGDMKKFWKLMEERTDLCYRALMVKHKRLMGTKSDVAPILWQDGALSRLQPGEVIDNLLFGDYSSISLGYAGLYECVKYLTGESHTSESGKKLALEIMQYLNDRCNEWKAETNIGFSVYGTPIESTTYKFAQCLQKRFGKIPGITDKDYITNSYHVNVREEIDAFTKLKLEGEFQKSSLGGCISYVEVPNMEKNLEALMNVVKFIYDNTMYAEINTKSDYCQVCGYDGEMLINDDMEFYCPNCGNHDFSKMNVARRVCGYISTNPFNEGRTQEIKERYLHLGNE